MTISINMSTYMTTMIILYGIIKYSWAQMFEIIYIRISRLIYNSTVTSHKLSNRAKINLSGLIRAFLQNT